jgi:hypothetical protein
MKTKVLLLSLLMAATGTLVAALSFNQVIVAIFGAGNPDTGWTADSDGNVVLALRAKNRENASTVNASGVYAMPAGLQAPNNNRARWNWESSINSGTNVLSAYDYYLEIDMDRSTGISNLVVNALTFFADNSYGNDSTLNGQGLEGPASTYASIYNIAQQSQNIVFYGLDATLDSTFTYTLYAVPAGAGVNGARIATVSITVIVGAGGPLPPDSDNDGVPDSVDQCPGTIAGHAVDAQGCSVQDKINQCAEENPADHGEYVACVVGKANALFKAGIITQAERKFIINTAAQSDIGK